MDIIDDHIIAEKMGLTLGEVQKQEVSILKAKKHKHLSMGDIFWHEWCLNNMLNSPIELILPINKGQETKMACI